MLTFDWISNHVHLIGWGTLITLCVKFIRFLTKVEARFSDAEGSLRKMATNDMPHIEKSMESVERSMHGIHQEMSGLRDDVKDFLIAALKK